MTVVVDTSVVVALFRSEADAADLLQRAMSYDRRVISAATWLEAAMVCEGREDRGGGPAFDRIVASLGLEVLAFTPAQATIARQAFRRYGKGRRHPASLSYGDCFSYALAKELGVPLLSKGDDFVHTDLDPA